MNVYVLTRSVYMKSGQLIESKPVLAFSSRKKVSHFWNVLLAAGWKSVSDTLVSELNDEIIEVSMKQLKIE